MNIFELFGTIAINNEQANKALSDTGKQAKGLSNTMEAAFSKMQGTARKIGTAIATVFAVDKIKDFGQSCAETFASVAAEESAFAQIMGDYAERATEKMQFVADQTGMVTTRLTPYMTSMTAKFKGLGYGVDEATNLAAEGLQIAADASAFWDKSLDESMSHLNSFINGSYEGGEAIGLFANDTQMAAYAVEQGIVAEKKAWSELDESRKQATRLQYAKEMMQSSGATGQAALEAENYANVQANLTEQVRQFQSVIGEPIMNNIMLPAMRRLSSMMPSITEKTEKFITNFTTGLNKVATYLSSDFDPAALVKAFGGMITNAENSVNGKLEQFGQKISSVWANEVWPDVQEYFKVSFGIELPEWSAIETNITTWWTETAKPALDKVFKAPFDIDLPDFSAIASSIDLDWTKFVIPTLSGLLTGNFLTITPMIGMGLVGLITSNWDTHIKPTLDGMLNQQMEFTLPDMTALLADITAKWNTITGDILNLCNVPVGLNPSHTNENGMRWSEVLADWFHGMVGETADHLKVAFNFVMPTAEETAKIQQDMTTWLHGADGKGGIVGLMANAISFPFELAFQECVNIWEDFQKWLAGISETGKINTETYEESEWTKGAKYNYRLFGYSQEELALMQNWIDATRRRENLDFSSTADEVLEVEGAITAALDAIEAYMGKERADQLHSDYQSWLAGQLDAEKGIVLDIPLELAEGTATELQNEITGLGLEAPVMLVPNYSRMNSVSSALGSYSVRRSPTVHWNAEGGIFDRPTIFSTRAGLQGVGEAGAEAVAPIGVLQKYVSDAVASQNAGMVAVLQNMLSTLNQISANTAGGHQVILDSGVLVGQIAPAMDAQLGTISGRKGRRN